MVRKSGASVKEKGRSEGPTRALDMRNQRRTPSERTDRPKGSAGDTPAPVGDPPTGKLLVEATQIGESPI